MSKECKVAKKVGALLTIPHYAVGISPYPRIPISLYSDTAFAIACPGSRMCSPMVWDGRG